MLPQQGLTLPHHHGAGNKKNHTKPGKPIALPPWLCKGAYVQREIHMVVYNDHILSYTFKFSNTHFVRQVPDSCCSIITGRDKYVF